MLIILLSVQAALPKSALAYACSDMWFGAMRIGYVSGGPVVDLGRQVTFRVAGGDCKYSRLVEAKSINLRVAYRADGPFSELSPAHTKYRFKLSFKRPTVHYLQIRTSLTKKPLSVVFLVNKKADPKVRIALPPRRQPKETEVHLCYVPTDLVDPAKRVVWPVPRSARKAAKSAGLNPGTMRLFERSWQLPCIALKLRNQAHTRLIRLAPGRYEARYGYSSFRELDIKGRFVTRTTDGALIRTFDVAPTTRRIVVLPKKRSAARELTCRKRCSKSRSCERYKRLTRPGPKVNYRRGFQNACAGPFERCLRKCLARP